MRKTFPKVRHSLGQINRLPLLLFPVLLLLASCNSSKKLNYRNGRYHSAQEIARMKAAERRGRPVKGASARGRAGMSSGGRKLATRAPKKASSSASVHGQLATVIETARSYRGTPYRFGGTTRLGLDCSGLLNVSFNAAGIQIPRSSNEQAAWGDPIRPQDLQAGDLVFFGGTPGSSTITHVGLITEVSDGGVQFIHSSTSLGVVENALESDYYLSRFIKAVRPKL